MPESLLRIRFDGLDANRHALDMRKLGESLIGIERIASAGMIVVAQEREPKKGERFPLFLKAQEPRQGSFDLYALVENCAWALPLAQDVVQNVTVDLLSNWFALIFKVGLGRQKEAEPHFEALVEITKQIQSDATATTKAILADRRDERKLLRHMADKMLPHMKSAVSPVGPSCDSLQIGPSNSKPLLDVDAPEADAIRKGGNMEVSGMETMRVRVDGFTRHNKQLKIEHPNQPGKFLIADVRDPAFEDFPNIYTNAASGDGWLTIHAKKTIRDGELFRLHILNAEPS